MQSPLDINNTAKRYNLDEALTAQLMAFDDFIWQDCEITSVDQLVEYEKEYQRLGKGLGFCYDNEIGEFGRVEMDNGPMDLLCKGRFQQFSEGLGEDKVDKAFLSAGLFDLETLLIKVFYADISGMFRLDAYFYGVPPMVQSLCESLNSALSKLPPYSGQLIRKCNDYDKTDFQIGDVFTPGFCLTTSADPTWGEDNSVNLYRITTLEEGATKARSIYSIYNNGEYQVTFLQGTQFHIVGINERGEGKKEFAIKET